MSSVTSRAQNRVMDRASRIESSGSWTVSGTASRGREKGVWGVERACHTGQHRSLQSACVTQEIGPYLGSRVLSSPGTRLTVRPRYLPDRSNPQAALVRWGRPPGLARAPCSRVRSCLTVWRADELLADRRSRRCRRRRRLGPGGVGTCCRPGSWCRRSTRCPTSRPCGSPTPPTPTAVTAGAGGRARRPAVCLSIGCRRAWVAIEHAAVVELHEPAVADDLDGLAGQPHPGLVGGGGEPDRALRADPPRRHRRPTPCSARRAAVAGCRRVARRAGTVRSAASPPIDWCGRSWL